MNLSRRKFVELSAAGSVAALGPHCGNKGQRPNIVLILADDLGYGDLGCFGSPDIRTPNIDRLARGGMRLTHHYACSPVCSPSRAGLLTGRYPQRTGVTGVLREEHNDTGLRLEEETLAGMLAAAGYETAPVGKWHLGVGEDYQPRKRGFQHFYGFLNGTIDYETHLSRGAVCKGSAPPTATKPPSRSRAITPS